MDDLDERTQRILLLYSQGMTFRQVGAEVGVSHETARTYVKRHADSAPMPFDDDDGCSCWMTTAEAAEALGIARNTLWYRIQKGKHEVRRIGNRVFVRIYNTDKPDADGLTARVRRMVELRSQGLSYAAIGVAVGVCGVTVEWHLHKHGFTKRVKRPRGKVPDQ